MGGIRSERLWLAGGLVAAAVLALVGWFILIAPQNHETSSLRDRTTAAELRLPSLRSKLAQLREQSGDLAQYQAKLDQERKALPTTSRMTDFLRQLQAAGDASGVTVSGLTVGAPTEVTGAGTAIYALPVSATIRGKAAKVEAFLNQIQQVQPRAVLIISANAVPDTGSSLADTVELSLGMQVFVAPEDGATPAPQPSASSN